VAASGDTFKADNVPREEAFRVCERKLVLELCYGHVALRQAAGQKYPTLMLISGQC